MVAADADYPHSHAPVAASGSSLALPGNSFGNRPPPVFTGFFDRMDEHPPASTSPFDFSVSSIIIFFNLKFELSRN
jgi:hypothetical protein